MTIQSGGKYLVCYSFLVILANDYILDANEIIMLEKLALSDGRIDDEERELLRNLLNRLEKRDMAVDVRREIDQFREANNI